MTATTVPLIPVAAAPPGHAYRHITVTPISGVCGAEVRMTRAANEDPEPPRHCMEEMELLTPEE